MDTSTLLSEVQNEIKRLTKVVSLLGGTSSTTKRRGRRKLSKAARAKISDAQKRRWAKAKQKQS